MRLFVAVPVPDAVRHAVDVRIATVRSAHPGVRWTDPAGWHLTLAFLGEVEAPGGVVDAVGPVAARHRPASLALGAPGRFGDRVLWLGIQTDPAGALVALAAEVGASLVDAGVLAADDPAASKPLRAHLTLARKRGASIDDALVTEVGAALEVAGEGVGGGAGGGARAGVGAAARAGAEPGAGVRSSWSSDRVEVWRSHLGRGPARYEVVASFPAAGGEAAAG